MPRHIEVVADFEEVTMKHMKNQDGKLQRSHQSKVVRANRRRGVCLDTLLYLVLVTVAATSKPMFAQNTTADVIGTVTDSTGAVVPGATVELTNMETQEKRVITSGGSGEYTFTLLKPSRYSLTVTAPGFKAFKISSFSLAAGDVLAKIRTSILEAQVRL